MIAVICLKSIFCRFAYAYYVCMALFTENNGQQESKNVTFPNPPPFPTDVQRSSSLTRGRKSGQDLLPFSRVSARGPQTRSGELHLP